MTKAAIVVPFPKVLPVVGRKIVFVQRRPRDEMATIICGKMNSVRSVVGGDDQADAVEDAVFAQIFFINAQRVRRCSCKCFKMFIQRVTIIVAKIARFIQAQDDGPDRKPLNRPSKTCGEISEKFHGPTARLTGSISVSLPMP